MILRVLLGIGSKTSLATGFVVSLLGCLRRGFSAIFEWRTTGANTRGI